MTALRGRVGAAALAAVMVAITPASGSAQVRGGGEAEPSIRVSGIGLARVAADEAQVVFAVETFATTAREAGRENARIMDRVLAALEEAGVPRDELETRGYSLYPEYTRDERGSEGAEPRIRGYRAINQVVATTRDLDGVGGLIDAALGAGANRMDAISFRATDTEAARAAALREAVAVARADAETMAAALGVTLGPVVDATTGYAAIPRGEEMVRERADVAVAASATPTPIQPGEQTVRAQVSIVFSIDGAR